MDLNTILRILEEEKAKRSIKRIGVFGSMARGEGNDESDVDVVLETEKADYLELFTIKSELEEKFHRKVDLVRLRERMNPELRKRIERDAVFA